MFELLGGSAGIALGALHAGDAELAVLAAEPYLRTADPTPGGVNWAVRPSPPRSHHIAHGTLGIAYALAAVGTAAGQHDLTELALRGAADVVARDEAGPEGFVVPHSDPQHRPDLIERYSYGWCNGPAGDAQVFRLLGQVTRDPAWAALAGRCWHTVTHCGLPDPARVLGQQRSLLRNSRSPGARLRPARRAGGGSRLRRRARRGPCGPGDRRCRRRALVQSRAPRDAQHARPAYRMGDGQRRHQMTTGGSGPRSHPGERAEASFAGSPGAMTRGPHPCPHPP